MHIYERCLEVNPLESQQEKNNDDIYHRSRASWKQESSNFCGKRLFDAIEFDTEHELSIKCDNKQTIDLLMNGESRFKIKAQAYRCTPLLA